MKYVSGTKSIARACCQTLLPWFCLTVAGFANAGVIDAEAIAKQLAPEDSGPVGRSLIARKAITFHVSPDAHTRACSQTTPGNAGLSARNLFIENAPSIDLDVAFAFDRSDILPEGVKQLEQLAAALKAGPLAHERFAIAGHTDGVGKAAYNDKLSCDRALKVRNYLRDKHGIDPGRIAVFGFGSTKLKDSERPAAEINRRTEVRLIPQMP